MSYKRKILYDIKQSRRGQGFRSNIAFGKIGAKPLFLSERIDKKSHNDAVSFITQLMLTFFRDVFAPYLMENFAFERKALPGLLSSIQQIEARLGGPKAITLKFAETKEKSEPVKSTKEVVKADRKGSSLGFKAGFLLKPEKPY